MAPRVLISDALSPAAVAIFKASFDQWWPVLIFEWYAFHREALQERTRDRVPLQWVFTQLNLALVYSALFDKDHQPCHLDDALEAADGALEEFRKAKAVFYIEKAEFPIAENSSL